MSQEFEGQKRIRLPLELRNMFCYQNLKLLDCLYTISGDQFARLDLCCFADRRLLLLI